MKNGIFTVLMLIVLFLTACKNKDLGPTKIKGINTGNAEIEISKLDGFLQNQMDSLKIRAISIAIINDAKIVYHRAIGVSNIETKERINENLIFEVASLSKPVFSFFTLKMAEKSIIDLDRPLFFYLEDKSMAIHDRYKSVTARMVLDHTTGFPNWRWFEPAPPEMKVKRGDFYMKAEPNTFTYSGEGYQYLARVLAHNNFVNMYELAELFKPDVASPLEMEHAYFVWDDFLYDHKVFGHKNN